MQPQLVPVITQAWSGDGHAPSHCGTSALPQDTLRHAHEPVPTAARQLEPAPHDPVHCPFSKRQAVLPAVVVVVELPGTVVVDAPGTVVVVGPADGFAAGYRASVGRGGQPCVSRRRPAAAAVFRPPAGT
jgi:hypothetical protein